MDKAGSVGLDLSFVPHLFLMEPFLDGALEEQVRFLLKMMYSEVCFYPKCIFSSRKWLFNCEQDFASPFHVSITLHWVCRPRLDCALYRGCLPVLKLLTGVVLPSCSGSFKIGLRYPQVVARAHRMGAQETVQVETLVMKVGVLLPEQAPLLSSTPV